VSVDAIENTPDVSEGVNAPPPPCKSSFSKWLLITGAILIVLTFVGVMIYTQRQQESEDRITLDAAVHQDKLDEVQQILTRRPQWKQQWTRWEERGGLNNKGYLAVACDYGSLHVAKLLLEDGANPNALTTFGESPLFFAITSHRTALVALLLEHGADIKQETRLPVGWVVKGAVNYLELAVMCEAGPEIRKLLTMHGAN
jgi:hypothetical protein